MGPPIFFDATPRQVCEVKAKRTNTPLHALTTLNDVTFSEAARGFAERLLTEFKGGDSMRLETAFRMATAREPSKAEQRTLKVALEKYRSHFAEDPDAAIKVASIGESKRSNQLDPVEHASWATIGLMLLNLDETITKE